MRKTRARLPGKRNREDATTRERQATKARKRETIGAKKYCCDRMQFDLEQKCEMHPDRYECPDALVSYSPKVDSYGLIVHDGGSSCVTISYCPWCGTKLPETQHKARR